ncbi:MAG: hypothetical protein UY23_C0001G0051 [Candidatus Jorgensenbacteria bacterium GW2011_GWA1_48_11]|uniref:DUF4430 domain-containing protein n=1 Tax=Candidatus Jorgensenbacteria bacterium GW2011_GWA1_48_11 TaxID=1618660 RepID=A0A0G1XAT6_9BACT|nr:MAG: hypothetical protein UY23_C0001G0051 [Candidatus Jorgensenbacteria bacterium GW2011_GWA1_48_11]KKW11939.1 MAG: hypothetical protein UY51_C0005G0181 [Candidatus Jorgensenbacteria bacterium GW2011_GWB1_49_9]
MKKNKATVIWTAVIVLVLAGLFLYPKLNSSKSSPSVPCLFPNLPLAEHIHPRLVILVDGVSEPIPAEIGLSAACERALHTHKDDAAEGVIHIESQSRRKYTLGDFFNVWGRDIDRPGYRLEAAIEGASAADPAGIILKDGEEILLKYTKADE